MKPPRARRWRWVAVAPLFLLVIFKYSRPRRRGVVWVTLTLPGEGASGWREVVAAAARAARDLDFRLAAPCVRDSQLACCFRGNAAALYCDPPGAGHRAAMDSATRRSEAAARVIGKLDRSDALDVTAYFDARALEAFAPLVAPHRVSGRATFASSEEFERRGALGQLARRADLIVLHDARRGIFSLAPYRDEPPEAAAALFARDEEHNPRFPLRLAEPLRNAARRFPGTADYDVLMWRSELAPPDALDTCAAALLSTASKLVDDDRTVVFVGDISSDGSRLWSGHDKYPPGTNPTRRRLVEDLAALGVRRYAAAEGDDAGAVALAEQFIAVHARHLWTQRLDARPPFKVALGPCGWEGRFLNTVLAARHALNATASKSWLGYTPAR